MNDVNLNNANLNNANLNNANLNSADLRNAKLRNAKLRNAKLRNVNLNNANLRDADLSNADLSDAKLKNANLRNALLKNAKLCGANLNGVNLSHGSLNKANLIFANLSDANLNEASLSDTNLSNANLSCVNLKNAQINTKTTIDGKWLRVWEIVNQGARGQDLSGADLSNANLSNANLIKAQLSGANLTEANLTKIQALGTNFSGAILTGASIEEWKINSETKFDNVICDYIYLKENKLERRPTGPTKNFQPGEFVKLVEKGRETVDLIFSLGIDWKAFLPTLEELLVKYQDEDLSIAALEKKPDGTFVVRLNVFPEADQGEIESQAKELYDNKLKLIEAQHRVELKCLEAEYNINLLDKEKEINELHKIHSSDLIEIAKLLANKPISIEAKALAGDEIKVAKISDLINSPISGGVAGRDLSGQVSVAINSLPNSKAPK